MFGQASRIRILSSRARQVTAETRRKQLPTTKKAFVVLPVRGRSAKLGERFVGSDEARALSLQFIEGSATGGWV